MSFQTQLLSRLSSNSKNLSTLTQPVIRSLLQVAVKSVEQEPVPEGVLEKVCKKHDLSLSQVDKWFSVIYMILRMHLRHSGNSSNQVEIKQCLQDLKLSNECIDDILTVLYGQKRQSLVKSLSIRTQFYPRITSFKWRIDVTISSSLLSRVLEPYVTMEWELSTGDCHTFQVSLPRFHQLRQLVAKLLLEIHSIENITVLKHIQNGKKML